MSGTLGLTTPWARQYFPKEERPAVEALIPDGYTLTIGSPGSPTVWNLRLFAPPTEGIRKELRLRRVYGRDVLPEACRQALLMWRAELGLEKAA